MRALFLLLSCFIGYTVNAQYLVRITCKGWDDFSEWSIFAEEENDEGELKLRRPMVGDWTAWSYRLGELTGQIELLQKNDLNAWKVRAGNQVVVARTKFKDDFFEWRLSDNQFTFSLKAANKNVPSKWVMSDPKWGSLIIYPAHGSDPRDWLIVDDLEASVPLSLKMAAVFLSIFHAAPH